MLLDQLLKSDYLVVDLIFGIAQYQRTEQPFPFKQDDIQVRSKYRTAIGIRLQVFLVDQLTELRPFVPLIHRKPKVGEAVNFQKAELTKDIVVVSQRKEVLVKADKFSFGFVAELDGTDAVGLKHNGFGLIQFDSVVIKFDHAGARLEKAQHVKILRVCHFKNRKALKQSCEITDPKRPDIRPKHVHTAYRHGHGLHGIGGKKSENSVQEK
jgi:hypothetical protein